VARTLQPEDQIAHYRIIGPIGAGGMGEVYRAHDNKLERDVALKVLPAELVRSEDRVKRFVMEAKSASSLNHPNIVTIYEIGHDVVKAGAGSEEADEPIHYIAMELIHGKTLRELIQQRNDDLRTILGHLAQAAEGLSKAHAAGIVHRDLKPGNIMVTDDGYAKLLDFGVAKLTQPSTGDEDMTSAPTEIANELTGKGQVVGTIAYMSPEQVKGKSVDHRSDVFSFGCILYETATGARPFAAESSIDTMHNIIHQTPRSIDEINAEVPGELRRLIRRCMAKNPDQRLQSIKDLAIELREIVDEYDDLSPSGTSATAISGAAVAARRSPVLTAAVAAVALLGVAGIVFGIWSILDGGGAGRGADRPFESVRMNSLMSDSQVSGATLSGDGRYLAYVKGPAGEWSLWVRQIATGSDVQILPPQTDGISGVSFSPDGNYLYYLGRDPVTPDYRALFEVASLGGTSRKRLFDVDTALSFSPDGRRAAFQRGVPQEQKDLLMVVDLQTGEETVLATVVQPENFPFLRPAWSPDGSKIVTLLTSPGIAWLMAFDATDGSREVVAEFDIGFVNSIAWEPDGRGLIAAGSIVSGGSGQVLRFPYPEGEPYQITNDLNNYSGVSISADGTSIAALQGSNDQSLWIASAGEGDPRQITPRSSKDGIFAVTPLPDGSIAFSASQDRYSQLFVMAGDGSGRKQITSGAGWSWNPQILPDGRGVVFSQWSEEEKAGHVWRVDLDGANQRRLTSGTGESLVSLSPDGQTLLLTRRDFPDTLWRMGIGGGEPEKFLDEFRGGVEYSPDGRFLLQHTWREVDGRARSFYRILPAAGGEPVATFLPPGAAEDLEWLPDGSGLAYVHRVDGVENVWLQPSDGGEATQVTRFAEGRIGDIEVAPDGTRLAFNRNLGGVHNLWTVKMDGNAAKALTDFRTGRVFDVEWSRDGRDVILRQGEVRREVVLLTEAGD
jgi:eukaryotic-like serine/threonine-protein kinase